MDLPSYVRLFSGADGESHFSDERFPLDALGTELGSPVLASPLQPASQYGVRVVPPGWTRDWAPAARPMIAVYLSGNGEIQASDGEIKRISPGMVLLAEDTTGPGHRVRVIGDDPVTVIHIVLPD